MKEKPIILWLRRDLRLADNPALNAACETGAPLIFLYIFDENEAFAPGAAARWWLHQSLAALDASLKKRGAQLTLRRGVAASVLDDLVQRTNARGVYWNRRYAPAEIEGDKKIKTMLSETGVEAVSFSANLLREPFEIKNKSGGYFKVFTPYWKALQAAGPARAAPLAAPDRLCSFSGETATDRLSAWALTPQRPNWAAEFSSHWRPGEDGARDRLAAFIDEAIHLYSDERDLPNSEATSRLSPHLAFGEISPLQIWRTVNHALEADAVGAGNAQKFLSEVAWREFAFHTLYHNDDLRTQPIRPQFGAFPWREAPNDLTAWQQGRTGYPIVDAAMRQLWRTGWMHNRLRMIAASFLVKHLLLPWQEGEAWFWDTLVDACPANNPFGWQWVAGCGADAAPYFRIFNPITQGENFDHAGAFTTRYAPELAAMPEKYLYQPWAAPQEVLTSAGVALGENYPKPIVEHAFARRRALDAFDRVKNT